jgi:hypothetical protein
VADKCRCGLPLDPPLERAYWWLSIHQPDGDLRVIVRHTEHPTYRRAERHNGGWRERGASVDGIGTWGLIPWERVGMCWAGFEHPVTRPPSEG